MRKILFFCIVLITPSLFGQVTFDEVPKDLSLVGRDVGTNTGLVTINGTVNNSGVSYDSITVIVDRNDVFYQRYSVNLDYTSNIAPFDFGIEIPAELANYSFSIYGNTAGALTLERKVDSVVAGDVFIIMGQSNAEAFNRSTSANANQSDFIRVYACSGHQGYDVVLNDQWFIGQGDGGDRSPGNTGQWGLRLARLLMDTLQIPIAIFNGAHTGMEIEFFQRPADYQASLNSNYGRLYYRLNKTGLRDYAKAVLWSQGETNADETFQTSTVDYKNYFLALHSNWKEDYPGLEKFYIFQTKNGCGQQMEYMMPIKEAQRQLAEENTDIKIMQTAAARNAWDRCHFAYIDGYQLFAERIFPHLLQDFYDRSFPATISIPLITGAQLVNDTVIIITTDADKLIMKEGATDYFLLENAGAAVIENINLTGNAIRIELSEYPGAAATVSYLCPPEGVYHWEFITNSKELEMVSFFRYPVQDVTSVGATGVSLYPKNVNLHINETIILDAIFEPITVSDRKITWTSLDPGIASVDANGVVTGIAEGTTKVAINTVDSNFKDTCTINISSFVYGDNIALGKPATADSYDASYHSPAAAVDGNITSDVSRWVSEGTGYPHWIEIDLLDYYSITEIKFWTGHKDYNKPIYDYQFQSWDGAGWVDFVVEQGNRDAIVHYNISGVITNKVRLFITNGIDEWVRLYEIKISGYLVPVTNVPVTGVSLSETSYTLNVSETLDLDETVSPVDATIKTVSWSSDNEAVATVNSSGLVTAVSSGSATITVTTVDGGYTATCAINVPVIIVPVSGVSLNKSTTSLEEGGITEQLIVTIAPANATDKTVSWNSDDESVATVNGSGMVTSVSPGTATITVTTTDGGYTATCDVTVTAAVISVTGLSLNKASTSILTGGNTEQLVATVLPANATNKAVTWLSDATGVATVNSSGLVTSVGPGIANIIVTADDGDFSDTCVVTVAISSVDVTGVNLNKTTTSLVEGGNTDQLVASVTPANATNQTVSWSSDDESVATVINTGLITSISPGTATITVTTSDGGYTATCNVTVTAGVIEVLGVSLNETTINMSEGGSAVQLTATVAPVNATDKSVSWSSDDESVALVNNSGLVSPVSAGTATVTVITTDCGFTATCDVIVTSETMADIIYNDVADEISIFPNPLKANAILTIKSEKMQYAEVFINNISGKQIYQSKMQNGELKLPGAFFQTGPYVIILTGHNKIYQKIIVVE